MNMTDYLKTLDSDGITHFAKSVGTKPVYLRQISYGFRRPSMRLALHMEHVTNGELTACELRPDLPWPETLAG